MNEQPEALRLADAMQHYWDERGPDAEAVAAELRRLHEANEEFAKRQKWWNDRMFELENALRQAVEALEHGNWYIGQLEAIVYPTDTGAHEETAKVRAAITAAKKALGEA